jgi:hypothetical protein
MNFAFGAESAEARSVHFGYSVGKSCLEVRGFLGFLDLKEIELRPTVAMKILKIQGLQARRR